MNYAASRTEGQPDDSREHPPHGRETDRQAQIDPWKRVETYVSDICLPDGDMFDVDVCLRTEVDAARAADALRHQQELRAALSTAEGHHRR